MQPTDFILTSEAPNVTFFDDNFNPDISQVDLILEDIKKGNFDEAITQFNSELNTPQRFNNLEKAFEYFSILLPHMKKNDDFEVCISHLNDFLLSTRHMSVHQFHLALLLGDEYDKRGNYVNAMSCFAQAIKIAEELRDSLLGEQAHIKASYLIFKCIKYRFLSVEIFKEKIEKARQTSVQEFELLIEMVKQIKKFCFRADDYDFIDKLFKMLRDVLVKKELWDFERFVEVVQIERKKIVLEKKINSPILPTSIRYHQALRDYRNFFDTNSDFKNLREFQTNATKKFIKLFEVLLTDAFIVFGKPPCGYDIRAIGSVGREEPLPYSDIEFFILITDEKHRKYFDNLLKFLELQVESLGENPNRKVTFACFNKQTKGFYLDPDGVPLKTEHQDLMDEPKKMASNQIKEIPDDLLANDVTLCDVNKVLASISLKNNDDQLFIDFHNTKKEILDGGAEHKRRHTRALRLFRTRLESFQHVWKNHSFPNSIEIKERYIQFLNFFLADLALYSGISCTNTLDILKTLDQIFDARSTALLEEAVSFIYCLRLRLHKEYQTHHEEGILEGISGVIFTHNEKDLLEKIYWLILRPLYHYCLPQMKTEEDAKSFTRIDLLSIALDEVYQSQENPAFFLKPYRLALAELIGQKTTEERLKAIYLKLSTRSNLEFLRESFLKVLEEQRCSVNFREQIEKLPNRAGLRLQFKMKEKELKGKIEDLLLDDFHRDKGTAQVRLTSRHGRGYMKPEIVREILDETADGIKNGYPGSGHHVIGIGGLHYKQKPMQALMEYAVHNLFFRISGFFTPPSELVRFEVAGNRMYPVLISASIEGHILKKQIPDQLNEIQWARWTSMLLCTFLVRPGDGLLSNHLCDQDGNIFSIDNDISFVEPFVKKWRGYKINFCSALFSLFRDRELDAKALREFCSLDADSILLAWIEDVIAREKEYGELFSEQEKKQLFDDMFVDLSNEGIKPPKDPDNQFKATILFKQGTIATLNMQFVHLQNTIQRLLDLNQGLTPIQLLSCTVSINDSFSVDDSPGKYLARAYQGAQQHSIEDRLSSIVNRERGRSLVSTCGDMACLTKIPNFEEIDKRKEFSPAKAKEELYTSLLFRSPDFISMGAIDQKDFFKVSFAAIKKDGVPDIERQKIVFKAMMHLLEQRKRKPSSVIIRDCAILDTASLLAFLHKDLFYLDVSFCPNIKNSDVKLIQKTCLFLKELRLTGCSGITFIGKGRIIGSDILFASLEILHVDQCPNLKTILIGGFFLKLVNGNGNPLLSSVSIKTVAECATKFEECLRLSSHLLTMSPLKSAEFSVLSSEIRSHRNFVLAVVSYRGETLQYASDEFRNDTEVVLTAVKKNGLALQYASKKLRNDKDVVLNAIQQDKRSLQYANEELRNNRDIVLAAVKINHIAYKYTKVLEDEDDTEFQFYRAIVLAAIVNSNIVLQYASMELRNDKEVVLAAVQQDGWSLEYASEELRNDREVVLAAVQQDGWSLEYASENLRNDREVVLTAVRQNAFAVGYTSEDLRNDRDVLLAADPRKNGYQYSGMMPRNSGIMPRKSEKLALRAIKQNASAINLVDEELREHSHFMIFAIQQNVEVFKFISEKFRKNENFVLAAVQVNPNVLEYVDEEIRNNNDIILVSVLTDGIALKYANNELRNDKKIVLAAVQNQPAALQYASLRLQEDPEVIKAVEEAKRSRPIQTSKFA